MSDLIWTRIGHDNSAEYLVIQDLSDHSAPIPQTHKQTNNINKQTNSDDNSVKYHVIQDLSDHDALITQTNKQTM